MTKLWEETGSALATRLFASSGVALVFWVWAFVAWCMRQDGWSYFHEMVSRLTSDPGLAPLLAVAVAATVVIATSSLVVERLTLPVLRVLEGYWPRPLARLRSRRIEDWHKHIQDLAHLPPGAGRDQVVAASVQLRNFPPDGDLLPTRIGNIIRAGERRPASWYGLDAVILWPHLWLVLPEQARGDLTNARGQLDRAVTAFTWAVLSCLLGLLWWPAALVGLVVAIAILRWWIPAAASTYATLISAVFDTHRFLLYDALNYPRPAKPVDEPALGRKLTRSLWDDPSQAPLTFTSPAAPSSAKPKGPRRPPSP